VDTKPRSYNNYIAFDIFFKNVTGSPVPDNLYYEESTAISMTSDGNEEMVGLTNSLRIGIVKVGTLPIGTDPELIQNMQCQDRCEAIIFEPYSRNHTELSIERARKYDINLIDGKVFPTYAMVKAGGPLYIADNISGSPTLDLNYFSLQNTIHEEDFSRPLFDIPDGVTKARVYVWIEGQDIDNYDFASIGKQISVNFGFTKERFTEDDFGYNGPDNNQGQGPLDDIPEIEEVENETPEQTAAREARHAARVARDKTAPVITLSGSQNITLTVGDEFARPTVTAVTDNVSTLSTSNVAVSGTVNTAVPGVYRVLYQIEDEAHNLATEVVTVTVEPAAQNNG
jgi:hypothetical protein